MLQTSTFIGLVAGAVQQFSNPPLRSDIIAFTIFTLGIIFYMPPRRKGPMIAVIVCLVAQAWKLGTAVGVALLLLCSAKLAVVLRMLPGGTSVDNICKESNDRLDSTMAKNTCSKHSVTVSLVLETACH